MFVLFGDNPIIDLHKLVVILSRSLRVLSRDYFISHFLIPELSNLNKKKTVMVLIDVLFDFFCDTR